MTTHSEQVDGCLGLRVLDPVLSGAAPAQQLLGWHLAVWTMTLLAAEKLFVSSISFLSVYGCSDFPPVLLLLFLRLLLNTIFIRSLLLINMVFNRHLMPWWQRHSFTPLRQRTHVLPLLVLALKGRGWGCGGERGRLWSQPERLLVAQGVSRITHDFDGARVTQCALRPHNAWLGNGGFGSCCGRRSCCRVHVRESRSPNANVFAPICTAWQNDG